MIDYVKISLSNIDVTRLLLLPCLDFKTTVSKHTGELGTKEVAEYHHCKITLYNSGVLLFTGSIHKLYNSLHSIKAPNYLNGLKTVDKGYNGTQFTLSNIIEIRTHLTTLFDCKPQQMKFQNIEFGINAEVSFNPRIFIKGLLYQMGKKFVSKHNENYWQTMHQRYRLKIYNKSGQYGMKKNTLRVETQERKSIDFAVTGIRTFADINTQTLENAKLLLLKRFDEVVYYDYTINKKELTKSQKQRLNNYSNPRYWFEDITVKNRDYHKQKLNNYIRVYSSNLHQQIRLEILKKFGIINRLSESSKFGIINSSSIELNIPIKHDEKNIQKCIITGVDLCREKQDAKYIQTKTLRYLKLHNEKKFIEICSLLLKKSNPYHTKYEIDMITHLAKQIRNRVYNGNSIKNIGYNSKKYDNQIRLF